LLGFHGDYSSCSSWSLLMAARPKWCLDMVPGGPGASLSSTFSEGCVFVSKVANPSTVSEHFAYSSRRPDYSLFDFQLYGLPEDPVRCPLLPQTWLPSIPRFLMTAARCRNGSAGGSTVQGALQPNASGRTNTFTFR
jgi:hypothetical protein